jgi:hypothetical protein
MRDALSSTTLEDNIGFQVLEWGFNPHYTFYLRHHMIQSHSHPDDVRQMHASGLNRSNRYVEHYKNYENRRMVGGS